jgi:hypothetical protein
MPNRAPETPALHDRALQDLSFIRRTMEGAAAFTDVPGWGLVVSGAVALAAAPLAARQPTPERWLGTWFAAALIAALAGSWMMFRKMRRRVGAEQALMVSVPARKFLLSFWPSILAGALITFALIDPYEPGIAAPLTARVFPGLWLLLYGLGVTTAGAFSIRAVPLMGLGFISLGAVALFVPALDGDLMMALGFGALQIAFGVRIARRYGG